MSNKHSPEMATRIRKLRKGRKLTQEEFAEKVGVDRSHISNIERCAAAPSKLLIKAICREFNVQEEWVLEGRSAISEAEGVSVDEVEQWEIYREESSNLALHNKLSVLTHMVSLIGDEIKAMMFATDALEPPDESVLADKEKLINILEQLIADLSFLFDSLELKKLRRRPSPEGDS